MAQVAVCRTPSSGMAVPEGFRRLSGCGRLLDE